MGLLINNSYIMKQRPSFQAWNIEEKIMHTTAFPSWNGCIEVWEDNKPQTKIQYLAYDEQGILRQYVGKDDVNGVNIHEGDVLKHHGQVVWNDEEHMWSCIDLNWNDKKEWHELNYLTSEFEIIGNIYQNPELIKTEND